MIINSLYRNELRLYKNFFQPVMKLKEKILYKGKVHRRYDTPKTPYQRIMESKYIPQETKDKLTKIYLSLNPAEFKRGTDEKVHMLLKSMRKNEEQEKLHPLKNKLLKLKEKATSSMTEQPPLRLPDPIT